MSEKFTKNTTLADVLDTEKGKQVLTEHNIPCLTCPFGEYEMENLTLAQICEMYNLDLEALLQDLNKIS